MRLRLRWAKRDTNCCRQVEDSKVQILSTYYITIPAVVIKM